MDHCQLEGLGSLIPLWEPFLASSGVELRDQHCPSLLAAGIAPHRLRLPRGFTRAGFLIPTLELFLVFTEQGAGRGWIFPAQDFSCSGFFLLSCSEPVKGYIQTHSAWYWAS